MWKVYHRLKVELVSRAFARRFSRSRGPIEGEKVKNGDEDFMNVCMITVELYERKQRGNARTRLLCYVDHRVFLTLINYYIVLDTRQRGHTMFDTRMAQSTDHVFGEQYVGRRERRSMQRESPVCLTIGMRRNMVEKERERRGKTSPYLNLLDSVQRMEAGHSSRQSLQTDETRTDVRC
ncbi:hypothetical protein ALC60_14690 [Trachymyrmex zeteki]|uniref:Uncharacterized protein n=1 Tax=Mycetomoellerius zeteki TaxID=64791 RepID=A0A151WEH2_9HYME|nr:PREDICTED: uncharacterized protein LOC108730879 isoform X1 [Trachymyrmex zeteki]KYQ46268.1 hypothetical protein ALC60_14690 [Trachymyrmex zeteki]